MKNIPLITIIVPVYNVEKYLVECVHSITHQTFFNLEILLINDGSTDNSKNICDYLLAEDERIKYFEKTNSGLSDTRNLGIEYAKGDYIMFVDSDDLISENLVHYLFDLIVKYSSDISICDIAHFSIAPTYTAGTIEKKYNSKDALCDFFYQKNISTSACGKLYSAELIKNIRFPSGMLYEDNLFLSLVLNKTNNISYGNAKYYGYRHRENSITTNCFSHRDIDILKIGEIILRNFKESDNDIKKSICAYQANNCLRIYLTATDTIEYRKDLDYCKKYLDENVSSIIHDKHIRKKLYFALLLYKTHIPRKIFVKLHHNLKRWK